MKTMLVWSLRSGTLREAAGRFLAGQATPPDGLKMLGRWHSVDLSIGFTLYEGSDPTAMYAAATPWADLLDLKVHVVVEDADAGRLLAQAFGAAQLGRPEPVPA